MKLEAKEFQALDIHAVSIAWQWTLTKKDTYILWVDLTPAAVESRSIDRWISCESNENWWLGRQNGQVAGFSGKFK